MNRIESIKFLYTQLGKQGLQDLVNNGKVSVSEYKEVVGEDCEVDLETLKVVLREKIREYKWVKAEQPFEYDGYLQENRDRDKSMMYDCYLALQMGITEKIEWKLPDETKKEIIAPAYFLNMKAVSTMIVQKCFAIEEMIVAKIEAMSIDEIKVYDGIEDFDNLFNTIE